MNILGLNAYHGDSSACLVIDGQLVAAVEEERFRRIKHWAGFPSQAVRYCLETAGLSIDALDHIAVNRNPRAHLWQKAVRMMSNPSGLKAARDRLKNAGKLYRLQSFLREMSASGRSVTAQTHFIEHHLAHLASGFLVSPFDSAAAVSVDGFGDFVSTQWAAGQGAGLKTMGKVYFPHSLGIFYLALTQYLGFPHYGDEYKVMGLAAYGKPSLAKPMKQLIRFMPGGQFKLNLNYFLHSAQGISMIWDHGGPAIGRVYSDRLVQLFGPARTPQEPLTDRHADLAASAQSLYEETLFHLLDHVYRQVKIPNLCLAGGCANNSAANGKITSATAFSRLYVPPAPGDAGGAVGAAFYVWNHRLSNPRTFVMNHAYWGPQYPDEDMQACLGSQNGPLRQRGYAIKKIDDPADLCRITANQIAQGRTVGWFQGRTEIGPRALGNRSILCDPRNPRMKAILNGRIKHRESFRPFAPSILKEKAGEWFERDVEAPFMSQVCTIQPSKRRMIPAVTHVDGSGRLQTVTREQNPLYYNLIQAFEQATGVPMLLNTSFNENEPIVCRPVDAVECFLKNSMDVLVMGPYVIDRPEQGRTPDTP